MPARDKLEPIEQIRKLSDEFEALRTDVGPPSASTPSTQLGPLLLRAQGLTSVALALLTTLDEVRRTDMSVSRAGLDPLAKVVASSAAAGAELAKSLYFAEWADQPSPGRAARNDAAHGARGVVLPQVTDHLAEAVRQLGLSMTGCRHAAAGISQDRRTTPRAPTPLTSTQYDALQALASGEGKLCEFGRMGSVRVHIGNARVSTATLRVLQRRKLVRVDVSTSLYHGQRITLTEDGRLALTGPRPAGRTPRRGPQPRSGARTAAPLQPGTGAGNGRQPAPPASQSETRRR
ncbi:hypothetical protein [Actinacidiphila sp. bgisy144]|uniref:hypothetical protein n=1 Tax=Actinacidiphila sp. bgisy144 TaxID=3413791 RepID=UPI003EBDB7B1